MKKRTTSFGGRTWDRRCTKCGKTKPSDLFGAAADTVRYKDQCKNCVLEQEREKKYGISVAEQRSLLKSQGNRCAICGEVGTERQPLCMDHDHRTGRVRGYLCHNHNRGLGRFDDNITYLQKAIEYLSGPRTSEVKQREVTRSIGTGAGRRSSK